MDKQPKDMQITIRLTSEQVELAQRLADNAGITRHKLITNFVVTGLETMQQLDSMGIVNAALMLRTAENFVELTGKAKAKKT